MVAFKQETTLIEKANAIVINVPEPMKKKWYRKKYVWGSIIDIIVIILIIVVFTTLKEYGYIPYVNQGFYCQDPKISYPYSGDSISTCVVLLVTHFSPILIMMTVEKLRSDGGTTLRKICLWYLEYIIGVFCSSAFMFILKIATGEPRPHFLHVCAPDAAQNCTKGEYITEYRCLNTGGFDIDLVTDSSLSFPSGHAQFAIFNSIFCAVFIHMRFNTRYSGVLLKPLVITFLFSWGFVVAVSRVMDNRHHWWDIVVGIAIAIVFAYYIILFHCDSFKVPANRKNKEKFMCTTSPTETNGLPSSLNNQSNQLSENEELLNIIR